MHHDKDWDHHDEDRCEDKYVTIYDNEFPTPPELEGMTWQMDLAFNLCAEEPMLSCTMDGQTRDGEQFSIDDCRKEQTPTPERYEEYAALSEQFNWDDPEFVAKYEDLFQLWNERTGMDKQWEHDKENWDEDCVQDHTFTYKDFQQPEG
jgi:hypothetical protein